MFVRFHFQTVDTVGQRWSSIFMMSPRKFAMNSFFCQCHNCSMITIPQNVFKGPSYNFSPLEPFKENQSFLNCGTIYFTGKGACKLNDLMKRRSTILVTAKINHSNKQINIRVRQWHFSVPPLPTTHLSQA